MHLSINQQTKILSMIKAFPQEKTKEVLRFIEFIYNDNQRRKITCKKEENIFKNIDNVIKEVRTKHM